MGSHSRQSSYEIGIAWPVAFASGRARVVTVGPPSRGRRVGAAAGEEVQGEVGHEDHEEVAKEGHGMSDPQLDQDTDGYADKCKGSDCDTIGHTRGQDGKGESMSVSIFVPVSAHGWAASDRVGYSQSDAGPRMAWTASLGQPTRWMTWMRLGGHILTTTPRHDTADWC